MHVESHAGCSSSTLQSSLLTRCIFLASVCLVRQPDEGRLLIQKGSGTHFIHAGGVAISGP